MKTFDKESKNFKIFTYVTLFVTGFYFLVHILFMILYSDLFETSGMFETATNTFFSMLLYLDLFSWFIYIPFAGIIIVVQSLYLIARLADTENVKKWFYLPSFLNIIFGGLSIYGIFQLFERAFQLIVS